MKLITKKTTLEEFKRSKHWLIKCATTKTLHHITVLKFGDDRMRLWYAFSNQTPSCVIKNNERISLLSISVLFGMLQSGKFNFDW